MDLTNALEKLFEMKQEGRLSEEEFQKEKTRLLAQQRAELQGGRPTSVKEIYKDYWRKCFVWRGRASRSEYWWPVAVNAGISMGSNFLAIILMLVSAKVPFLFIIGAVINLIMSLYMFVTLIPTLAVQVRRFHDLNKSAWFTFAPTFLLLFLVVVAGIGAVLEYALPELGTFSAIKNVLFVGGGIGLFGSVIIWFIYTCLPGTPGPNRYGDPRI